MGKASIGLWVALFASLLSMTAAAEPATVTIMAVERETPQGDKLPGAQINRADCLGKSSLVFTIGLEHHLGYGLEIWAGTACDTLAARQPSATAACWRLYSEAAENLVTTAAVDVRQLLSGRTLAGSAGSDGTSTDDAACEPVSAALGPQSLSLYVMLLDGAGSVGGMATYKTTYKLVPPPGRDIISVASADRQLSVELSPMVTDPTFDGVLLFCDPAPGDPNAAANAQTATNDAGVFVPMCAPSAELVAGADGATLSHLRCGMASRLAITAVAPDLVNGVSYNIAAASVDSYGNVGPLSGVACQVPQARASNVRAEACSFAAAKRGELASALVGLIGLGAVGARRCRRRAPRGR